ncbi:MAG: hypothetical protein HY717_16575 [Planctomycetes bacterium]|nr:hypothetical protein [Planctomycetota bacterium]
MFRSFVGLLISLAAVSSLPAQGLVPAVGFGSVSAQPGEVVDLPLLATFNHPLSAFTVNFRYDQGRLEFIKFGVDGTPSQTADPGSLLYLTYGPGEGICGVHTTQTFPFYLRVPPGEGVLIGKLRFRIRSGAEAGPAAVAPVPLILLVGTALFELVYGTYKHVTPEQLVSGSVDVLPPRGPRPVGDLQCLQHLDRARISFSLTEAYDAIEVFRGPDQIAVLPGTATEAVDPLPGPGRWTYTVVARRGLEASIAVACEVLATTPAAPPVVDLACGEKGLQWTNPLTYDRLFIFKNGDLVAELSGGAEGYMDPGRDQTFTVYTVVGELEGFRSPDVHCLENGFWSIEIGDVQVPLKPDLIKVPIFITGPERLQGIAVSVEIDETRFEVVNDPAGAIAGTAAHPESEVIIIGRDRGQHPVFVLIPDYNPPRQLEKNIPPGVRQHVFNILLKPRSELLDGEMFPLALVKPEGYPCCRSSFTVGGRSVYPDILIDGRIQAGSGVVAEVKRLKAEVVKGDGRGGAAAGETVSLSWQNGGGYEGIAIERNGRKAADLPGGAVEWVDEGVPRGLYTYKVIARRGGSSSFPAQAFLSTLHVPGAFVRGDANQDAGTDMSDAVFTLRYLFLGEQAPTCEDAADADDDGAIAITDPIAILRHLFLGGPPLKPPGAPFPWFDATLDSLGCGRQNF